MKYYDKFYCVGVAWVFALFVISLFINLTTELMLLAIAIILIKILSVTHDIFVNHAKAEGGKK